jgi:Inner membrane component of T3SS, cytoplasmic domain
VTQRSPSAPGAAPFRQVPRLQCLFRPHDNARRQEGIIAMSATQSLSDACMARPPAVGGLLSLVTRELFRFEDPRLGNKARHGLTIGASGECDIVLRDPFVSSLHAAVTWYEGAFRILDLASRNGVFQVMSRRAQQIRCVELALGQRFVVGRTTLVCVTAAGHAPLTAFDIDELASLSCDILANQQAVRRLPREVRHELRRWVSGRNRPT